MTEDTKKASIEDDIWAMRERFDALRADPNMSFDREAEWAIQTLYKQEKTTVVADGNRQSVREAMLNVAAIGVTLNTARKLAYLLVRDGAIVYDLSYLGLIEVAVQSGAICWAQAEIVRDKDVFRRLGVDKAPLHEYEEFRDRGEVIGAYVTAKLPSGDFLTATMPVGEINEIRDKSRGANSAYSPWKNFWSEMARKTVVKRGSKYWKTSSTNSARLDMAIQHLNDGHEGIEFSEPPPPIQAPRERESQQPAKEVERQREPGDDDEPIPPEGEPAGQAEDKSRPATEGEKKYLQNACVTAGVTSADLMKEFSHAKWKTLTVDQFQAMKKWVREQPRKAA